MAGLPIEGRRYRPLAARASGERADASDPSIIRSARAGRVERERVWGQTQTHQLPVDLGLTPIIHPIPALTRNVCPSGWHRWNSRTPHGSSVGGIVTS